MNITERFATVAEIANHPLNSERRIAAVWDYLRWNLGHRLLGSDHVAKLATGARLIISDRQNYATLVYTCGLWDFQEQAFLLHLLQPEDTFVDIGANVGGYTVLASAVTGAKSIAFEPVPETFEELQRNIRLNAIAPLVQCYCCALGEIDGASWMTASRGGLNHIVAGPAGRDAIEVQAARMDTVLANTPCRLLKIDAEGFELSILRGGQHTLSQLHLQGLIVELNGSGARYGASDEEVHRTLCDFEFQPCRYEPRTRVLTPLPGHTRERGFNTLYVRDPPAVARTLATARPFSSRGQSF